MTEPADLLIEVGTEELPPRALLPLSEALASGFAAKLEEAGLEHGPLRPYATPRRLALIVEELAGAQPDRPVEKRGPPVRVAFDKSGAPTRAALAFADGCGVRVEDLERIETGKGEWLAHRGLERGRDVFELVPELLAATLEQLPIPRRMRWGSLDAEFVRPVHWLVLMHGADVIQTELYGVRSGNTTFGHRFHAPEAVELAEPQDYASALLERGRVVASFEARRARIEAAVRETAKTLGGDALIEAALLDEVTALVEWPVAISGHFAQEYLELPEAVLIATLQDHQRYFPVRGDDGRLAAAFITVSNIESLEPEQVRAGNERVVLPRLADAQFFWNTDRKHPLAARVDGLDRVVFQSKLGSLGDRSRRVANLTRHIAEVTGADVELAARAATLAKTDLLTEMVGEFPELQGTMGRYYALNDGEPAIVAQALEEQYLPRFAGDRLPESAVGAALAVADKLDTVVGSFAIGARPTGTRDPFGIRRATLGMLRIFIEGGLDLDLNALIGEATAALPVEVERDTLSAEVYAYCMERLRAYYLDDANRSIDPGMFDAVLARRPTSPVDFDARLRAVEGFVELDAAESLAAANKRLANILRQAGVDTPQHARASLLTEPAERSLHQELTNLRAQVEPLLERREYEAALVHLAALRAPVDRFFDEVMVMCDDVDLRSNRLALLSELRELFLHTADLSRLQPRINADQVS